VPTIVREGAIELKVYADTMRHSIPHVHVWIGGESVASVSLLTLRTIVGGPVSRKARQLIKEHFDALADAWEACND
jgi:Domain of unknown function (DUF4160)